jgi:hypothetical protein
LLASRVEGGAVVELADVLWGTLEDLDGASPVLGELRDALDRLDERNDPRAVAVEVEDD